jgi:hypothetical protein
VRGSEFPAFSSRLSSPIRSNRSIVDAKILYFQPLARNSRIALFVLVSCLCSLRWKNGEYGSAHPA